MSSRIKLPLFECQFLKYLLDTPMVVSSAYVVADDHSNHSSKSATQTTKISGDKIPPCYEILQRGHINTCPKRDLILGPMVLYLNWIKRLRPLSYRGWIGPLKIQEKKTFFRWDLKWFGYSLCNNYDPDLKRHVCPDFK